MHKPTYRYQNKKHMSIPIGTANIAAYFEDIGLWDVSRVGSCKTTALWKP
jgi:hypothetical protein